MLDNLSNIGSDVYQSWSEEQRREEIGKLVQGYKNGLPVQILCQLATSIAGSSELACQHLSAFMTLKERKAVVKKEAGGNDALRELLQSALLQ